MAHDPRAYLWDVEQAALALAEFISGMDEEGYLADRLVRAAVERQFEIIREALNQLSKHAPDLARNIANLAASVAFRNVLIHGYARLDHALVWRNAQERLPELRAIVAALLTRLGPPDR